MYKSSSPSSSLRPRRHLQLWLGRGQRFLQRRPLLAKAVPTAVGFAFGDCLTQRLGPGGSSKRYNYVRTAQMFAIGAAIGGPVTLAFLRWMHVHILPSNPYGPAALSIKFTLDQVVGCFIWQLGLMGVAPPYRRAVMRTLSSVGRPQAAVSQRSSSAHLKAA